MSAAKSETSAAATAAASTARTGYNPLEEFFEADRGRDDDKPVVYGRNFSFSLFVMVHTSSHTNTTHI